MLDNEFLSQFPYEAAVSMLIREHYSIDDELAIQRQKDSKPEEYAEYNAFCEECKQKAKEIDSKRGDSDADS